MPLYYSPSEGGFFDTAIHSKAQIPADVLSVTEAQRRELHAGICRGMIVVLEEGALELREPPEDPDAAANTERAWRDNELANTVWLRDRHRDQLDIGVETTLSSDQFNELLVYMQALRDWPQSPAFPATEQRPVAPAWIATQRL